MFRIRLLTMLAIGSGGLDVAMAMAGESALSIA
jgi:hypothetical protein